MMSPSVPPNAFGAMLYEHQLVGLNELAVAITTRFVVLPGAYVPDQMNLS